MSAMANRPIKITVIGAGFSGLVTAYYLRKRGHDVEVIDKSKRVGGLIATLPSDYGLIETGANGILNSSYLEDLCKDLGLVLHPTRKEARKRFIFRASPKRWPLYFLESLALGCRILLKLLVGFKRSVKPLPLESVAEWGRRNFGEKFIRYFLGPALQGIYAGDIERLSASLIFGPLLNRKKEIRPLALTGTVAPRNGMGQLIEALRQWLVEHKVNINTNTEVVWDPKLKHWKWVIATGAHEAAKILAQHKISKKLEYIEVSPLASITAFFHPLDARTKGFGILFPRDQGIRALGVLINNEIFEGRSDYRSETWIYGGALDHEFLELSEPEMMSQLLKDRKVTERGIARPIHYRIQKWPAAIPHYTVGLEKLLPELPLLENTYLIGNYLGALGLAKILEKSFWLCESIDRDIRRESNVEPPKVLSVTEQRSALH